MNLYELRKIFPKLIRIHNVVVSMFKNVEITILLSIRSKHNDLV